LALKSKALVRQVIGIDRDISTLEQALQLGVIDVACNDLKDAMVDADLVLLAAPVAQTESILRSIYPYLSQRTIVTDVGSTKCDVIAAAKRALNDKIAQFVPAHPIAGRAVHGPQAALATLFSGKYVVVTPLAENSSGAINYVANLWRQCEATVQVLEPLHHDRIFASVSHLPHLLAYAMVNHITDHADAFDYFKYAASGFRDFTRIASSSPEMWRDIALANSDALLEELNAYQGQLRQIIEALQQRHGDRLLSLFSKAQTARQDWLLTHQRVDNDGESV
jgi:prephenate dehydrogenase